jgi:hypothetical protein
LNFGVLPLTAEEVCIKIIVIPSDAPLSFEKINIIKGISNTDSLTTRSESETVSNDFEHTAERKFEFIPDY